MTAYQPGDRLRVTFEGVVVLDGDARPVYLTGSKPATYIYIPSLEKLDNATIERILPSLVVGQPVPLDRLGELPEWSIVARPENAAITATGEPRRLGRIFTEPPILLRLGDGTT